MIYPRSHGDAVARFSGSVGRYSFFVLVNELESTGLLIGHSKFGQPEIEEAMSHALGREEFRPVPEFLRPLHELVAHGS